jgi:hypothetical protein
MKPLSADDAIVTLGPLKKAIQGQRSSKRGTLCASFAYHKERYNMWDIDLSFLQESAQIFLDEFV